MFAELIFTRCRQGLDILKGGRPVSTDGFKVYSCTPSLLEDGNMDLPFLFRAAQGKQPYKDPDFMDDVYLFYVPDKGAPFLVDYHPIPYNPAAQGDYSHRAGNFINQILVGDYTSFYPFELFRDNTIWDAKARGEAYYYENAPEPLPARDDVSDPVGQITLEDLAEFIADGRREALKAAVSFLIAQYEMPLESRRFLAIRDTSSEHIEKWVAAIEHAFSPRMAASVPFATRLEKFSTANRYTVNPEGVYQSQINLQDPNQKQRCYAMIVGVDERDKTNNAAIARPLVNAAFVVLDGKEKRALFEAEVSHRYYQFITTFDENHQAFCREFLQMLSVHAPSTEIFKLYDIFESLRASPSLPSADIMKKMLTVLSQYQVYDCMWLRNMYKHITADLPRFFQENRYSALAIIQWLLDVAPVVGDQATPTRLVELVNRTFAELVFQGGDLKESFRFWESIKKSRFASRAGGHLVSPATLESYGDSLKHFGFDEGIAFVLIYIECANFLGTVSKQDLRTIVNYGLKFCESAHDEQSARKLLNALSGSRQATAQELLFSIARDADQNYADFLVNLLIKTDASIVATDASMQDFFKKLGAQGMEHLYVSVLKYRIRTLVKPSEIDHFLKLIKKIEPLSDQDLVEIFETLDRGLVAGERGSVNVAMTIQQERPKTARCTKSAHIYALEILDDKNRRANLVEIYNTLLFQGFPSEENPDYIYTLTERLLKAQLSPKELDYVIQLFSHNPAYIADLVSEILAITTFKRNSEWNVLIGVATRRPNSTIDTAIIEECARLNKAEKVMGQLNDLLTLPQSLKYFAGIADCAKEILRSRKPQSGFGRLFGAFSGNKSDPDDHRTKR